MQSFTGDATVGPGAGARYLEVKSVSCERGDRLLFDGLSFQLGAGEGLRIIGANGSGKTTLLRVIAGLSERFGGDIHWRGQNRRNVLYQLRTDILYFGHAPGINVVLTPLENLEWWQQLKLPGAESREHLVNVLDYMGLAGYSHTPCAHLSAGQKRRVALARLLISRHRLWILDEPFTAIDRQGVRNIEGLVEQHLQRGGIVILTTHQAMSCSGFSTIDIDSFSPGRAANDEEQP